MMGKRPVRKPRGRWKDAVLKYTVGLFHVRNWKSTASGGRMLEEGDRGGHVSIIGRRTIEKE